MELIRISENKIKIMLSAVDMRAYDLPAGHLDYCEETVRDAFRAVLKDAGRKTGVDFSDGRLSIQLYPSKTGGCEMFVTRNEGGNSESVRKKERTYPRKGAPEEVRSVSQKPQWERAEAFAFESLRWLLSVCKRLHRIGYRGSSAAFRDESGRCFLVLESSEAVRPIVTEYGTAESASAVRLYISEHGRVLCTERAVETLGIL